MKEKLKYLLDTNIISELLKQKSNENVFRNFSQNAKNCAISSVSVQEIVFGIEIMPEGRRKNGLKEAFEEIHNYLPILDFSDECGKIAGEILGKCQLNGEPRPYDDTQIAATAVFNGLILVTRNIKDFEPMTKVCDLKIENWFWNLRKRKIPWGRINKKKQI